MRSVEKHTLVLSINGVATDELPRVPNKNLIRVPELAQAGSLQSKGASLRHKGYFFFSKGVRVSLCLEYQIANKALILTTNDPKFKKVFPR